MSFLRQLRDARAAERVAAALDGGSALAELERIRARNRDEPRVTALLARAFTGHGRFEEALALAGEARGGLGPGAGGLLIAEVLLDRGETAAGRAALEEARRADPGNLAVEGLLLVLSLEESGMAAARERIPAFPAGALWCSSVVSRLLLALETEIESRASSMADPARLHRARTVLFRPRLEKESFPRFWADRLALLLGGLRGRAARAARERKEAVRRALRSGELARAAEILAAPPSAHLLDGRAARVPNRVEELYLALEIAFVGDRFGEVGPLHAELIQAGNPPADAYPAALAAYALLARGEPQRAQEVLAPALAAPGGKAELRHLAALAELKRGRRFRAAAELRAAAMENDIALERLAREEADLLSPPRG